MISVSVQVDTKDVERATEQLGKRAPYAIARALNRAGESGVTAGVRAVSQDTGIKQGDLKGTSKRNRRIWSRRATPGDLVMTVYADVARIPLADFKARGPGGATPSNPAPSRGKGRGVSWSFGGKARGRERRAFLARLDSGHVGVFKRMPPSTKKSEKGAWSKNLPIAELHGPSVGLVWKKKEPVVIARVREQLAKSLVHEIAYEMRKG